jgi:hypothetical protein
MLLSMGQAEPKDELGSFSKARHQGPVHECLDAPLLHSRDQAHYCIHVCLVDSYHNKHAGRTSEKYLISVFATTMRTPPAITDLPHQT